MRSSKSQAPNAKLQRRGEASAVGARTPTSAMCPGNAGGTPGTVPGICNHRLWATLANSRCELPTRNTVVANRRHGLRTWASALLRAIRWPVALGAWDFASA